MAVPRRLNRIVLLQFDIMNTLKAWWD